MLKPMHTQAASSEAFGNLRNNWRICERSDEVHLVVDEFGQAEELGFRQCDLPIVRKLSAQTKLRVQFSDHCCRAC